MISQVKFRGFTQESLNFLRHVQVNNSLEWFESQHHTYEQHLIVPFKLLLEDLTPVMMSIDDCYGVLRS